MHLRMAKVQVIGPKSLFLDVVSYMHQVGTLHVENITREIKENDAETEQSYLTPMIVEPILAEKKKKIESALMKINGIIITLKDTKIDKAKTRSLYKELYNRTFDELLHEVDLIIDGVKTKATELYEKKNDLEAKLFVYSKYEPILEKIQPLAKQICTTEGFESIALLLDKENKAAIDGLREELENICKKQCHLVSADVDEKNIGIIIIYNKIYSKSVHDFFSMEKVNEIKLPEEIAKESFENALAKINDRKKEIPGELKTINTDLENISATWHHRVIAVRNVLKDKDEEIKVIPQFGSTGHTFIITGWIPEKDLEKCSLALINEFLGKVALLRLELTHHELEEAPVSLNNPAWAKPFEFFYSFVKKPRYGGIDPTIFMAVFFPIIFGMMVGDIGYGIIIFGISYLMKNASKGDDVLLVLSKVLRISSIGAIIWGFMYMEIFGNGLEVVFEHFGIEPIKPTILMGIPFPLDRMKFMKELLILAIIMGVIHIGFGLIFGFINGIREKNRDHAFEKAGIFSVIIIGPILLIIGVFYKIAFLRIFGGVAISIGIVLAAMGGGIRGIVEILGTFSNAFSYARIMAIGLAGVILGVVANSLGVKIGGMGGIGMKLAGIFLAILLHSVNIIVSSFSPSIHTLRLHLVECFSKFYEPAKSEYKPFKKMGGE
ncbi:MAG: V-type ATPase 116kDa subunit family protein [bacterium]|nr:V-type ATPase 116kDa subunit family protein [bacterium]